MNIGIDARILEKEMGGIRRYTEGILKGINQIKEEKNRYFLFCIKGLDLDLDFRKFNIVPTFKGIKILEEFYSFSPYWLNFVLPNQLEKYKIDICFFPAHFCPLIRKKTKYIIVIHDMAHKFNKFAKGFFRRLYINIYLGQSIKRASAIITVSENSKRDILKAYPFLDENKIFVIPEAVESKFYQNKFSKERLKLLREKYKIKDDIVLYVGKIEERKNILTILKVADILFLKGLKVKFLLIGNKGYKGYNKLKKEINKRLKRNVIHIEYVNDSELIDFYNLAKVFLFPSFYEGFGLPVLEAMRLGLPVVTSNTSSLPEIVGEGGIMHDPTDYESFAKSIERLLEDEEFYNKMKEKSLNQAKKFTWKNSAENLLKSISINTNKN